MLFWTCDYQDCSRETCHCSQRAAALQETTESVRQVARLPSLERIYGCSWRGVRCETAAPRARK
jgi:hypothetical protein